MCTSSDGNAHIILTVYALPMTSNILYVTSWINISYSRFQFQAKNNIINLID